MKDKLEKIQEILQDEVDKGNLNAILIIDDYDCEKTGVLMTDDDDKNISTIIHSLSPNVCEPFVVGMITSLAFLYSKSEYHREMFDEAVAEFRKMKQKDIPTILGIAKA